MVFDPETVTGVLPDVFDTMVEVLEPPAPTVRLPSFVTDGSPPPPAVAAMMMVSPERVIVTFVLARSVTFPPPSDRFIVLSVPLPSPAERVCLSVSAGAHAVPFQVRTYPAIAPAWPILNVSCPIWSGEITTAERTQPVSPSNSEFEDV